MSDFSRTLYTWEKQDKALHSGWGVVVPHSTRSTGSKNDLEAKVFCFILIHTKKLDLLPISALFKQVFENDLLELDFIFKVMSQNSPETEKKISGSIFCNT